METWVHGAAVAFDPGDSDRTRTLGNQIDISTGSATIRVGDNYAPRRVVYYVFPWTPGPEGPSGALMAVDEVLVRIRSSGDVGIVGIDTYAAERQLMEVHVDDPVTVKETSFGVVRFRAERPQGWTDFDTPVRGPIAVGLTIEGLRGGRGSVDVAAVGVRLRPAYLGP